MKRIFLFTFTALAAFAQSPNVKLDANSMVDAALGQMRFPERTFAALPAAAAGNTGWRYTITDCLTSACVAGGGSIVADLRSTGSAWVLVAGAGGAAPAGSDGQLQLKSGSGFSAQAAALSGGGSAVSQRGIECATGTATLSGGTWTYPGGTVAAAAAVSQEITIVSGLDGRQRYSHVLLNESTQFTSGSVTVTKASVGRPGASTNDELMAQQLLMQTPGTIFAFDRPQPPILGSGNTYTLVLAIRTTGGNISALTTGAVDYEVCGYKLP